MIYSGLIVDVVGHCRTSWFPSLKLKPKFLRTSFYFQEIYSKKTVLSPCSVNLKRSDFQGQRRPRVCFFCCVPQPRTACFVTHTMLRTILLAALSMAMLPSSMYAFVLPSQGFLRLANTKISQGVVCSHAPHALKFATRPIRYVGKTRSAV
jgi:hypothetical protein